MEISVLKDTHPEETRVALIPENVKKLVGLGAKISVEKDIGKGLNINDSEYEKVGAKVV